MRHTDIQFQEMREEERDEADNGDVVGVELISEFWEKQVRVSIIFVWRAYRLTANVDGLWPLELEDVLYTRRKDDSIYLQKSHEH